MENIKIWLLSFGCALFLTSILKLIISDSHLEKTANIFFSVFITVYMLAPIKSLNFENVFTLNDESKFSEEEIVENGYDMLIENTVNEICINNSVKIISLKIDSEITENGEYTVSKIRLEIQPKEEINNIKSALEKELEFEVTVT